MPWSILTHLAPSHLQMKSSGERFTCSQKRGIQLEEMELLKNAIEIFLKEIWNLLILKKFVAAFNVLWESLQVGLMVEQCFHLFQFQGYMSVLHLMC